MSGSWIGAAEHVQRCTTSLKCSGPKTCTAWSAAIAVPIAFVPAPGSLHSVPSVKFMWSAARRRRLRAALDAQQDAVGVGDDDEVVGVLGDGGEALVDQRRGAGERVLLPQHLRLVLVGDDRRELVAGRVDARRDGAPPGVDDRLADVVRIAVCSSA